MLTKLRNAALGILVAGAVAAGAVAQAASPSTIQPNISVPMCALPNGVLMVCVLYNQMVDGGETAPTGAPTTYTQLTSAQIGTTTAEITANFPSLITTIFTNSPYINIQMANMPPGFLATLSHTYYASLLLHTSRPIFIEFLTLPTKVLDTRFPIA